MTSLKWMIPIFALFMLILTVWVQYVRGDEPIIPWIYFSSQQSGDDELYRMHPDGTTQQRLSFAEGRERYLFINEEWVYFYRDNVLYRMHPDGAQPEPILSDYSWYVTFSPDEQWLYFMAEREGVRGLYRMRPDGQDQTRLTPLENEVWFQTFDENNEWLYYTLQEDKQNNDWALYRMHLDGSEQQKIVDIGGYDRFYGFDPAHEWLYFESGNDNGSIWRMNLTDFRQEQLTPDDAYDAITYTSRFGDKMRLSADGLWFYTSTSTGDANFDVYRMRLDGSVREKLTNFPEDAWLSQLAPNGERVYFTMDVDDIQQIFSMRPDGSDLHQVSDSKADVWSRAFSPDGQWLIYTGYDDFYRVRLDGTQNQNLTSATRQDTFWAYSQDGEWMYFSSQRTGYRHLYRMRPDGRQVEQLTPTYNGDDYWGMFGTPIDLAWHEVELRIITLVVLGIFFLGYGWYAHSSTRFAINH